LPGTILEREGGVKQIADGEGVDEKKNQKTNRHTTDRSFINLN